MYGKIYGCNSERPELALREISLADAEFIHALYTGSDFRQGIGDRGITSLQDARDYIEQNIRASYQKYGFGLWLVEHQTVAVGICGLVKRDYLPHPDLGFALLPDYYGQGLARCAAARTLELAREQFQLSTLLAITSPTNQRSQKLLLALDFKPVPAVVDPHTGQTLDTFAWQAEESQ